MNFYNEIKEQLINNEITKRVKDYSKNKSDLDTYYSVGKLLNDAGKHYGEGIIKHYSIRLTNELGKGYSTRTLKYMRKFYLFQKRQQHAAQLTWSHYIELLVLKDYNAINYYIDICINQNLSRNDLRRMIKNKEYERLDDKTKNKLINKEKTIVSDFIKNPILINSTKNYEIISEKTLQKLILENIPCFLDELGIGFTFIRNKYKIKIGDRYNYIDLLLFNYIYNSFVVVELKITELKKEHIGQIETYVNYIDKNLKNNNQNKTIGIIIIRKNNKFIMEYCTDNKIFSREFILKKIPN